MTHPVAERKNEERGEVSEEVPASEARDRLTELVNRVAYGGEVIVITRNGKPIAQLSGIAA